MLHNSPQREIEIYEDLSTFLQAFKRAILHSELIFLNHQRNKNNASALTAFSQAFEQIKSLAHRNATQNMNELQNTTFNRFIYRLIEIISNCKIKHNNTDSTAFHQFLKQMEAYIRECDKKKNFLSLINCTLIILLKFVNKILFHSTNGTKSSDQTNIISEMMKNLRSEQNRLKQGSRMNSKQKLVIYQQKQQSEMNDILTVAEKRQKIMNANKLFTDIQHKFDQFKGMQLDFSYFRGSFFESKANYDAFYLNYLQRNNHIASSISFFREHFQSLTKRRQNKSIRKIKTYKTQKNKQIKSQMMIQAHTEEDNSDRHWEQNEGSTIMIPFCMNSSKASKTLKNIYINLGKNSQIHKNHHNITTKLFNNKSISSESSHIDTSSIDPAQPHRNRIRTQPYKSGRYVSNSHMNDNQKMVQANILGYISPKVSIKTKNFQLTSLPTPHKTQIKGTTFSGNKFSIKLADKYKIVNWFSQK